MYRPSALPVTEPETKPDPFSLPALIAWLRTKPADEVYCFMDFGGCLFAQYLTSIGIKEPWCGGTVWSDGRYGKDHYFPRRWLTIAPMYPHTFGAALARAEALLK